MFLWATPCSVGWASQKTRMAGMGGEGYLAHVLADGGRGVDTVNPGAS
jgi:hypothetical protein